MNPTPSQSAHRSPTAAVPLLLALSTACIAALPQAPLDPATQAWNPGDGPTFHRVVFDAGQFLAVGANGSLAFSRDGLAWEFRNAGVPDHLRAAVHGPDAWWVVGDHGLILTSKDTIRWDRVASPVRRTLCDVAYSRCQFIAVGASGTILTSYDGWTWTRRRSGVSTEIRRVVDAGPFFMAGGANRTLLRSKEGSRWYPHQAGGAFGIRDLIVTEEHLLAIDCCRGGVFLSLPEGPWTTHPIPGAPSLNAAAYGADRVVAVGSNGITLSAPSHNLDGLWQRSASGTTRPLHDVAFGHGRWVAVGSGGTLLVSEDGQSWQTPTPGLAAK